MPRVQATVKYRGLI